MADTESLQNVFEGLTQVAAESALGTPGTYRTLEVVAPGNALGKPKRVMLENKDQRRNRHDHVLLVPGLQNDSPVAFEAYLKGLPAVLDGAATPVAYNNAAALSQQPLLQHWLGGEVVGAGSLVVGSADATHVTVTAAQGARFTVGAWCAITTSAGVEPRRVIGIAADTLQLFPALIGTPTVGGVVRNSYTYYLSRTQTGTLSVQTAYAEPGIVAPNRVTQRAAAGVHGAIDFKMANGQVPTFGFAGRALSHTDPGELTINVAPSVDDMGACQAWDPVCYLGAVGGTPAATGLTLDQLTVKVPAKWALVPGKGLNGVAQVARTNAQDAAIEIGFRILFDPGRWTALDAQALEHLIFWNSVGSGANTRITGVHIPRFSVTEEPQEEYLDNLVMLTVKGRAYQDTTIVAAPAAAATPDVQLSNILFFTL